MADATVAPVTWSCPGGRVRAALVTAFVLTTAGVVAPHSAAAAVVQRLGGSDRASTTVAITSSAFAPGVSVAVVATEASFPDALAGGAAAVKLGAPLLLTPREALPAAVEAELRRLQPGSILVIGGPAALSDAVVAQLRTLTSGPVDRLAGADRYGTAAAVAARAFPGQVGAVYVANGLNFADALAGGPLAGRQGAPVLLTKRTSVPAVTVAELQRLRPAEIRVLGGDAVVGAGAVKQLAAIAPVVRLAGADRYATGVEISRAAYPFGAPVAYLATGLSFPDALVGGPVAGAVGGPLLLVAQGCIPPVVKDELDRLGASRVVVLGTTAAVDLDVDRGVVCTPPPGLGRGVTITIAPIQTFGFAGHLGADWLAAGDRKICPSNPECGYWSLREVATDGSVQLGGVTIEPDGVVMSRIEMYPDLVPTKWGTNDNWDPALTVGGLHLWNPDGRPLKGLVLPHASNGAVRYVAPAVDGGTPVADGRLRSQVFQLVRKDGTGGAFNIASSRGGQWTAGWIWPGTYELFFFDDATGHSIYLRADLQTELPITIDLAKSCFGFAACTTLS